MILLLVRIFLFFVAPLLIVWFFISRNNKRLQDEMIQLILNFRKSLANPNSKTIEERLSYYKKIESDLILHEDRFTGVLKSEISEALKDIDDLIDQLNKEKRNAKKSSTN